MTMNTQTPVAEKSNRKTAARNESQPLFRKFFIEALQDIYWAEKHIPKGLQKMQKAATCKRLIAAFKKHEEESPEQLALLEQVFAALGEKAVAKKCDAMEGLMKETDSVIEDTEKDSFVRNAALILCAQKIEHYEIATYGTLCALAGYLPEREVQQLLGDILAQEKKTDVSLTEIAEAYVNQPASEE